MSHYHSKSVLVRVDPTVFDGHEFGWQLTDGRIGRTMPRTEAEAKYPKAVEVADDEHDKPSGRCVFCAHLSGDTL